MTTTQANATATTKANASARRKSTRAAAKKDTVAKQTTKQAATNQESNTKTQKGAKKEVPKKDLNLTVSEEKPEEKFQSMCGFEYDPTPASSCNKTCSKDNPDAYKACLDNFEKNGSEKAKKVTTKKKATRGKTAWGHLKGCQGGLVDEIFLNGGAHTIEEIMEYSGGKEYRVRSHMRHVRKLWNLDMRVTDDKRYFVVGYGSEDLEGTSTDGFKTFPEEEK